MSECPNCGGNAGHTPECWSDRENEEWFQGHWDIGSEPGTVYDRDA